MNQETVRKDITAAIINISIMKQKNIDQLVDVAMQSLDGIERATPKPFLLTRIHAGRQKQVAVQNTWNRIAGFLSKPLVATAGILLILGINITIIAISKNKDRSFVYDKVNNDNRDEYSLSVTTIYEIDNHEP